MHWRKKDPSINRNATASEHALYRQAELDAGKACGNGHAPKQGKPRGGGYRIDCTCGWKGLQYADEDPNAREEWVRHILNEGAVIRYPNGQVREGKRKEYARI